MKEEGFFERVYQITRLIPFGRVTSYGAIANYLGTPGSARMVGWALNSTGIDNTIPAHRVVNRVGVLTGKHHFNGTNLMQQLLENENITIKNNQVEHFKNIFWDPLAHFKEQ